MKEERRDMEETMCTVIVLPAFPSAVCPQYVLLSCTARGRAPCCTRVSKSFVCIRTKVETSVEKLVLTKTWRARSLKKWMGEWEDYLEHRPRDVRDSQTGGASPAARVCISCLHEMQENKARLPFPCRYFSHVSWLAPFRFS